MKSTLSISLSLNISITEYNVLVMAMFGVVMTIRQSVILMAIFTFIYRLKPNYCNHFTLWYHLAHYGFHSSTFAVQKLNLAIFCLLLLKFNVLQMKKTSWNLKRRLRVLFCILQLVDITLYTKHWLIDNLRISSFIWPFTFVGGWSHYSYRQRVFRSASQSSILK